jgi:hypothetical protein
MTLLLSHNALGVREYDFVEKYGFGVQWDHYLTKRMAGLHMTAPPIFMVPL